MSILIGRHVEGITINPLEYILDNDTNLPREFESEEIAVKFLQDAGFEDDAIKSLSFVNKAALMLTQEQAGDLLVLLDGFEGSARQNTINDSEFFQGENQ